MSTSTPPTCPPYGLPEPVRGPQPALAGAAPGQGWLHIDIDIDATLVIDHSDNQTGAASTWKKTFGYHPLLAFLDLPEISGGEALVGMLRNGNTGSDTASDHIIVLERALAALPQRWRPNPDHPADPDTCRVLVRSDTAGATHRFAAACRTAGVGFSFGYPVDARVQDAVDTLNLAQSWYPAIESQDAPRDGAWVADDTTLSITEHPRQSSRKIEASPERLPLTRRRHLALVPIASRMS